MKKVDKIQRDNLVRIYDNDLLNKLNEQYTFLQKGITISRNTFLNKILELGIDVYKKQEDDNWAIKNETTTLLDAIHEHTKRMNFFIKFSQPFIKTAYADCEINQKLLTAIYNYCIEKMDENEREEFLQDINKYVKLPDELYNEKQKLKEYYTYKTE